MRPLPTDTSQSAKTFRATSHATGSRRAQKCLLEESAKNGATSAYFFWKKIIFFSRNKLKGTNVYYEHCCSPILYRFMLTIYFTQNLCSIFFLFLGRWFGSFHPHNFRLFKKKKSKFKFLQRKINFEFGERILILSRVATLKPKQY